MIPRYHFILGLIPAVLISFINPIYGALFLIGAFFIDFDHYMVYVLAFKDFSISRAVRFFADDIATFARKHNVKIFLPFHNIETFVMMLIICIYLPVLYFLFFGMIFHYVLDLIYDYHRFNRFVREFSIIGYILRPNRFSINKIRR